MSNTAINTFGYTGIVTLSQYIGNKKIKLARVKNSGKYPLFNFFSDCLVGDFDRAKFNRPTKIMLLSYVPTSVTEHNEEVQAHYESRSSYIYLRGKPEKVYSDNLEESIVKYSFVVDSTMLARVDFDSIGLYTSANGDTQNEINDFAAIVNLKEDPVTDNILGSYALIIDWELHISDKGDVAL